MKPYTSIDLPISIPSEIKLMEYCKRQSMAKEPNLDNGMICVIGTMAVINDYRTVTDAYDMNTLYDNSTEHLVDKQQQILIDSTTNSKHVGYFYFERDFDIEFPELVEAIKQLPFQYLTGAFLLMTGINRESKLHKDPFPLRDYPLSITSAEPSRYNIQLNHFDDSKFFLQESEGSEKIYVKVTPEYPCFAFNNSDYYHGADSSDTHRLQILLYGILNEEHHQKLIKHSIEKFGE